MILLKLSDFSPEAIADSGQCFRFRPIGDAGWYRLVARGKILQLRRLSEAERAALYGLNWLEVLDAEAETAGSTVYGSGDTSGSADRQPSIPGTGAAWFLADCDAAVWTQCFVPYFDLKNDYSVYRALCLPQDEFLSAAMAQGGGIRILRQEPWEMLISFIISQRRSVPAIRTAVEKLSVLAGEPLVPCGEAQAQGAEAATNLALPWLLPPSEPDFAFPAPEAIAALGTEALSSCGLGYRVPYVAQAAEAVSSGRFSLEALDTLPDEALLAALMSLPGVGIKVASCVALFAYYRLRICPEDVWMLRIRRTQYQDCWPEPYSEALGVLQQYLFHYARKTR